MKATIALIAAMLAATPALAEEWDFILTNASGKAIKNLALAPAGSTDWKPRTIDADVKQDPLIKPSARTTVRFDKAASQCRYDLQATFEDGTTLVWSGANVCNNSYFTLKLAGGKATIAAN